jgi:hypothetical protein
MFLRTLGVLAVFALAGACAPLTAERPLFSPLDQTGPAPLTEGVWRQAGCVPEASASEDPCVSIEVARAGDGAWLYTLMSDDPETNGERYTWRFIIASAVETARGEEYAPLYVAEYESLDEPGPPLYAVVAPVGVMPAQEVRMVAMIDCDDALREGPIPGVEERHADDALERLCIAADRGAVREAARRALIENLPLILSEPRARFVWSGPLPPSASEPLIAAR